MVFGSWFRSARRQKLLAQPLPDEWRKTLARNVALYRLLPASLQQKLVAAARIIAAERRFVGCKGLAVTDEMKITIAAQAALLVLGEEGYHFDRLTTILLYPYKMVLPPHGVRPTDESDFDERVILGQAFQQGEIVLSWPDVLHGGRVADDGENVVLHELAHHLDGLDGHMGGSPPGLAPNRLDHFQRVFDRTLAELRRDLAEGGDTVLFPPAAESAAELFAYASEAFFEQPAYLRQQYPDLFDCLREFYKLDPTAWFAAQATRATGEALAADDDDDSVNLPATPAELPPLATADEYFARGQEFMGLGRPDLASADFDRGVRLDPSDQEALVWRGRANLSQGHVEAALADAERACRLDQGDGEAHSVRGMCLAAAGRYSESLDAFARAESAVDEDPEAQFLRGIARAETGDWDQAARDFTGVIDLDPDDAEARYERGVCYEQLGRSEEARRDLAKARELGYQD